MAARRALEDQARAPTGPTSGLISEFHKWVLAACATRGGRHGERCRVHQALNENLTANADVTSSIVSLMLRREKMRIIELLEQTRLEGSRWRTT